MKKPLVSPLDRNSTKQAKEMATFYDETLGFTPTAFYNDAPTKNCQSI